MENSLCKAISLLKKIEFYYDGKHKIVEPHTIGINLKGNIMLSGFQVRGESSRDIPDWGQYLLEKIENLSMIEETFTPRTQEGYKRGHDNSLFTSISCEV